MSTPSQASSASSPSDNLLASIMLQTTVASTQVQANLSVAPISVPNPKPLAAPCPGSTHFSEGENIPVRQRNDLEKETKVDTPAHISVAATEKGKDESRVRKKRRKRGRPSKTGQFPEELRTSFLEYAEGRVEFKEHLAASYRRNFPDRMKNVPFRAVVNFASKLINDGRLELVKKHKDRPRFWSVNWTPREETLLRKKRQGKPSKKRARRSNSNSRSGDPKASMDGVDGIPDPSKGAVHGCLVAMMTAFARETGACFYRKFETTGGKDTQKFGLEVKKCSLGLIILTNFNSANGHSDLQPGDIVTRVNYVVLAPYSEEHQIKILTSAEWPVTLEIFRPKYVDTVSLANSAANEDADVNAGRTPATAMPAHALDSSSGSISEKQQQQAEQQRREKARQAHRRENNANVNIATHNHSQDVEEDVEEEEERLMEHEEPDSGFEVLQPHSISMPLYTYNGTNSSGQDQTIAWTDHDRDARSAGDKSRDRRNDAQHLDDDVGSELDSGSDLDEEQV